MRALLWSDYFWPAIGGTEIFALNLVRGLQERGVELEVVATTAEANDEAGAAGIPGLVVHRLPMRRALAHRALHEIVTIRQTLTQVFARFRPALVHEISLGPGDVFLHAARRQGKPPCLVTLQQHIPAPLLAAGSAVGRAVRGADWIATCSTATRVELLASVPEVAERCSVIHNALPHAAAGDTVDPPPAPRLLCLGRLVEEKGFDTAIRAFAALQAVVPEARLVIAGDGPQRAALETSAQHLGIAARVDFRGWVHPDATAALIDAATIVVMPSRREPLGLVALEAALRGRPVVAARVGGLPEVVDDGVTGLLVPAGDVSALTAALARLLREPAVAAGMGRVARAYTLRRYSWQQHVDAYHALYLQLAGHNDRGR